MSHHQTPVFFRRPIMVRPRIIHELAMKRIDDVHYDLSLKTQAGTYPFLMAVFILWVIKAFTNGQVDCT